MSDDAALDILAPSQHEPGVLIMTLVILACIVSGLILSIPAVNTYRRFFA
jgi:hypothetical protein